MRNIEDWKKIIAESADQKFPKNINRTEIDCVNSIKRNFQDVEEGILRELEPSGTEESDLLNDDLHGNKEPNYRIACLIADILILAEKRKVNIEGELAGALKWFMQKVFIFHGTEGHPQENWFPWLKQKIEEKVHAKGLTVFVPQFPSPPVVPAKISEWFDVMKDSEKYINEETILIGHSLGGIFTLRILEKLQHPVCAAFLIGTPIGIKPILNYDRDDNFSGFQFDWEKIRTNAKHFFVFHSDNDPYVDLKNGEELAKKLGVELSFVPNAGHFNKKAGYTEFNELWVKLESLLAK